MIAAKKIFSLTNHIENNFDELSIGQISFEHNNNHVYYIHFKNLKIKLISFLLRSISNE
jgi:hypothetical protein